jgi:hypothetical protein
MLLAKGSCLYGTKEAGVGIKAEERLQNNLLSKVGANAFEKYITRESL